MSEWVLIKMANIDGMLLTCYSFNISCLIYSRKDPVHIAPILQVRKLRPLELKDPKKVT